MPSDSFVVEISPVLLEALEIPGDSGGVDYFTLLGLDPDRVDPSAVDTAVMSRTRALRQWQNSPEHGPEAILLLPMLHRIAAILKDAVRCQAYRKELDRLLSGEEADHREEFRDMVRAALADGNIERESKEELLRFARETGIEVAEAGRIVNEIAALSAARAEPLAEEGATALELGATEVGAGPYRIALKEMAVRGQLRADTKRTALATCEAYDVTKAEAETILAEVLSLHFRALVKGVASGGVINNNQARLLLPKSVTLGINGEEAFAILSEYTITGASLEDLGSMNLSTATFDSSEIGNLLTKQKTVYKREKKRRALGVNSKFLLPALLGVTVVVAAVLAWTQMRPGSNLQATYVFNPSDDPLSEEPPDTAPPDGPDPVPTQGGDDDPGEDSGEVWGNLKPDPESGLLTMRPEKSRDPASFEIRIHEVTCEEYQLFINERFYPRAPLGWSLDMSYPEGEGQIPVTGVTWKDAVEFCHWVAETRGIARDRVRLATHAEFARVMRAPTRRGMKVADKGFWNRVGFTRAKVAPVGKTANDVLFFEDGQVYDLIGNVAEWSQDGNRDRRILLGGDFKQRGPEFDPLEPRPFRADARMAHVGFRYVITEEKP